MVERLAGGYSVTKYHNSSREWHVGATSTTDGTGPNNFYVYDNNAAAIRLMINTSGNLRLNAYGAGTLSTDGK